MGTNSKDTIPEQKNNPMTGIRLKNLQKSNQWSKKQRLKEENNNLILNNFLKIFQSQKKITTKIKNLNKKLLTESDTPILDFLKAKRNEEIRYKPVLVIKTLLEDLKWEELERAREKIKKEYCNLFHLEEDDQTIKENKEWYWPTLLSMTSNTDELKAEFIDPIINIFPKDTPRVAEAEVFLIHELIWMTT